MRLPRVAGLVVAGVLVPVAALAGHARPGLWSVTTTIDMPNMPQLTADQLARMKAAGVRMPNGNTFTGQHCVTAREAAMDVPATTQRHNGCSMSRFRLSGQTMTASMVCTGDMQAKGQMIVTYDSQTHYTGSLSIAGTSHGAPVSMANHFEGRWIAADCGRVNH